MKKFAYAALVLAVFFSLNLSVKAQKSEEEKKIEEIKGKLDGVDENVTTLLTDVAGLKKLKISGYMQVNFEKTENTKGFLTSPFDSSYIQSRFRIRRSRVKVNYDAGLTQFVLQGDFSNSGFELKDAYMEFTEPWLKTFSLRAGVFNRPVYEVEYSSSQRESPERSKIITTLYPKERDLGAMLTIEPENLFKFQFACFNNTFKGDLDATGVNGPNFNEVPLYYMARITKDFIFPDLGLGIDIGAHARFGSVVATSDSVIESDQPSKGKATAISIGDKISRSWFGFEMQLYYDFLGGMKIMGEYLMGSDVNTYSGTAISDPTKWRTVALRKRDFNGFYVMLVKNIFTEWQVAAKYDSYNPNTKLDEDKIDNASEYTTNTFGFGLHNYTFDNVRITLWYDITKTPVIGSDKKRNDLNNNLLTLRFQYKF